MLIRPNEVKGMFHVHPEGTDEHAHAEGEQLRQEVQEKLDLQEVYGGIHFVDPSRPEKTPDIEENLDSLEAAGIRPGIEFNIIQAEEGWRLDISPEELRALKEEHPGLLAIASIHAVKAFGFTKESDSEAAPEQTADAMLAAYTDLIGTYGSSLDVLGHPFGYVTTEVTPEHMRQLASLASEQGIALEINLANTGLYNLHEKEFLPSVEQITQWNPVLRFPEVLEESDVLLSIGGDFHGNSTIEQKMLAGTLTDEERFQDSEFTYAALRMMVALDRYMQQHDISRERIINTWDSEDVASWSSRCFR
ncbi:hypothetical protein GF360_01035 [candidate division WWE3 bacterium]|nr:hypothetical protein [candidate division WWE3 bacterium]